MYFGFNFQFFNAERFRTNFEQNYRTLTRTMSIKILVTLRKSCDGDKQGKKGNIFLFFRTDQRIFSIVKSEEEGGGEMGFFCSFNLLLL